MSLAERLIVDVGVDKVRIGVVLRVGHRVAVACATSTDRSAFEPHVMVSARSRDGIILGLSADSWFLAPVDFVSPEKVRPRFSDLRLCPDALFDELLVLLEGRSVRVR